MALGKRNIYLWFLGTLFFMNWEVTFGAVVWHLLAGKVIGHAYTPTFQYELLACAVFFIYGLDRILDIHKITDAQLTERQLFYKKNQYFVLFLLAASMAWGIWLFITNYSVHLAAKGGIIAAMAGIYLVFRYLGFIKGVTRECFVAVVFTTAVWGYQIVPNMAITYPVALLIFAFLLTCMANLFLISWREVKTDDTQHNPSAALVMGVPRIRLHALLALLLAMILALTSFWIGHSAILDVCAAIIIIHNIVHYFLLKRVIKNVVYFRIVIDSLFLFPIIALL
jgi:hypothetical protein